MMQEKKIYVPTLLCAYGNIYVEYVSSSGILGSKHMRINILVDISKSNSKSVAPIIISALKKMTVF